MDKETKSTDSLIEIEESLQALRADWVVQRLRSRRIFLASVFEISSLLLIVIMIAYVQYVQFHNGEAPIQEAHFNAVLLIANGWFVVSLIGFFFECFTFLLTNRAIIVGITQSSVSLISGRPWTTSTDAQRVFEGSFRKGETAKVQSNDMADIFREYIGRSQRAVDVAQRRPNVLLFVGTAIAIVGLWFFIETLPQQASLPYYASSDEAQRPINIQLYEHLIAITPRVLMLLFIQVLAGFFLRQYRASMEEFRYYERILRYREAQFMSYNLRKELGDVKSLTKFSEVLMQEDKIGLLKKDETTAIIQAHREEANEFNPLIANMLSLKRNILKPKRDAKRRKTMDSKQE